MKELNFRKQNTDRWKTFESITEEGIKTNPDELADLFIQLTDDLAYARTNYPKSRTTIYLNNLTAKVHQSIYRSRKEKGNRFITFWTHELPLLMYDVRKDLLYSFIIFALATLIGVVSTAYDENFTKMYLGSGYVNMTIDNIKKGDPMAVYKSESGLDMFLQIPWHNMQVAIFGYIGGILCLTIFILITNGIMLGTFQWFFYKYGLLATSASIIWIHGTLEISCIIISGCAGLVINKSILFPGTYSRMQSFMRGAVKGLKICIGILPILLIAGFLESFITRMTDMPVWGKLSIIISSAAFIIWYFILYPIILHYRSISSSSQL
jgi:uncharacterized membrane protein SpoIIM required for sporulation